MWGVLIRDSILDPPGDLQNEAWHFISSIDYIRDGEEKEQADLLGDLSTPRKPQHTWETLAHLGDPGTPGRPRHTWETLAHPYHPFLLEQEWRHPGWGGRSVVPTSLPPQQVQNTDTFLEINFVDSTLDSDAGS